jgi:ribosome-associated protein
LTALSPSHLPFVKRALVKLPRLEGATGRHIDSRAKALLAAQTALEKHAEGVVVMDVRALSSVTDFFVICTALSSPQLAALQEHIDVALAAQGACVWHTEGIIQGSAARDVEQTPQWILMDCGDIVVHLLDQQARAFYRLDELWADAPRVPLGSVPTQPS